MRKGVQVGRITDGRIFSDEEIRQQIAENYTRRGEYRDSYMTPAERKEVKDELLNIVRCWHSIPADGDLLAVIEAARLLLMEF